MQVAKNTYDEKGDLIKEKDALGLQGNYGTEYTYDLQGNIKTILYPESKELGLEYNSKTVYDAVGRIIEEQQVSGIQNDQFISKTIYEYDDLGNLLIKKVSKDSNAPVIVEENTYDYFGRLIETTAGKTNVLYEYNELCNLH